MRSQVSLQGARSGVRLPADAAQVHLLRGVEHRWASPLGGGGGRSDSAPDGRREVMRVGELREVLVVAAAGAERVIESVEIGGGVVHHVNLVRTRSDRVSSLRIAGGWIGRVPVEIVSRGIIGGGSVVGERLRRGRRGVSEVDVPLIREIRHLVTTTERSSAVPSDRVRVRHSDVHAHRDVDAHGREKGVLTVERGRTVIARMSGRLVVMRMVKIVLRLERRRRRRRRRGR